MPVNHLIKYYQLWKRFKNTKNVLAFSNKSRDCGLRRSYYLSEIKRKTDFSFVFHSFNRNFAA